MLTFYERLKGLCEEKETSLTNVIKELGMSSGNLSKWKSGKTPKSDTVSALAEYFGVSSDYLLGIDTLKEKSMIILDNPSLVLTADEKWFIEKLRQLDKEGRTMVESTLIAETRRVAITKEKTASAG